MGRGVKERREGGEERGVEGSRGEKGRRVGGKRGRG